MTPVELVLSRLPNAKRNGKGWAARCPAHDDKHPSLSISEGEGGRALVHCHAGCAPEEILSALGLKMADLMPPNDHDPPQQKRPQAGRPRGDMMVNRVYPTCNDAVKSLEKMYGPRAALWTYHNAGEEPVGAVVRWDTPEGKRILPVSKTRTGWIIGAMPSPRPLYRLPDLLGRPNEPVYVVEGEKCADAMASLGLLSTTSAAGANAADKSDWTPLAGREVVILPDNDEPGKKYAADVAAILATLTPPARVRIVNLLDAWPDLADGEDIADVVERVKDADAIKAKLDALVEAATPKAAVAPGPVLVRLADVEPREIRWLWPGRVPLGRITLLVGRSGVGKSFLTCDMAARVSTGTPWPDGSDCPAGSVILVSAEDDPADTIRPRLDAHYADVQKVHLLSAVRRLGPDGRPHEVLFTLADVAALESALKALPDCRLIVVDPIGSFLGGDTDAHRDNEVRGVLAPVAKLAEKYGPAVLVVAHRRKSTGSIADDLALGSRAFTGIARAVWHLSRDKENKVRRLLLPGKNNLAPEGNGLAFSIVGDPPAIAWEHDPVTMSADDALAVENGGGDDHKPGPEPEAMTQAAEWLAGELADLQEHPVKDLKDAAKGAGLVWRTVQRASQRLGVKVHRGSFGGGCIWRLPKPATSMPSTPSIRANPVENGELGTYGTNEDFHRKTDDSTRRECHTCQDKHLGTYEADRTPDGASTNGGSANTAERAWLRELLRAGPICGGPKGRT
jgi:putative DNA primase/helicase